MPQLIEVPGHGQVEFPDGMNDEQIVAAIKANSPRQPNEAAMQPEAATPFGTIRGETDSGFNPAAALIKSGGVLTSINRGMDQLKFAPGDWLKQKLGIQAPGTGISDLIKRDVEQEKPYVQDLQSVNPGSSLIGDMLPAAGVPWRALPALAASEYGTPGERVEKGVTTFLGGKLAEKGGQLASRAFAKSEQNAVSEAAQNAVKDSTLAESQAAGYAIPPSQAGGGVIPRVLEGISGKYKTNQAAALKNQNVTDSLARKALGMGEDAPITSDALKAVRANAYEAGYAPVREIPTITPDATFKSQVQALTSRADNAAKDFGDIAASDVKPLVDGLSKVKQFSGDTGVDQVAILREKAGEFYAQGNKTLGKAYRGAADAIEGQLERALQAQGKDGAQALQAFRDARQLIAKTHSVENALVEGGGKVNAKVLGAALQRGKPLSGELETIGKFANNFKDVAGVPQSGWANPITVMDAFGTGLGGAAGMGVGAAALPAARIGSRALILSPMFQKRMHPTYGPNRLFGATAGLLDNPLAPYAGGLLGYSATR